MQLSKYEQETIITYNEAEQTASAKKNATHNRAMRTKLDKLAEERPEDCKVERVTQSRQSIEFLIPKTWIRVYPPRKSAPMSEERKEQLREQLSAVRRGQ